MQSPSISVIVPVYNVQAWLPASAKPLPTLNLFLWMTAAPMHALPFVMNTQKGIPVCG